MIVLVLWVYLSGRHRADGNYLYETLVMLQWRKQTSELQLQLNSFLKNNKILYK